MAVALYARVSTTRQADNDLSIPDQLRQLHEWAKANGHLVVKEYVEPGASATDDKRPVFQEMIADFDVAKIAERQRAAIAEAGVPATATPG